MSGKAGTCDTATCAPSKNSANSQTSKTSGHDTGHKCVTASPSKEVVLLSQGDIVEVTVKREDKTKGQKRTSPAVNSGYGQKSEKKRSMTNDNETSQSWGRIFAEQNLSYMKQAQSAMSAKHGESKETRKHAGTKRQQTNHVKLAPVVSKRTSCSKRSSDGSKSPCCQPVLVQDRAIQHPDMNDNANRFSEFNPVRTLSFLIKELKDLVRNDKRTSEIFNEMERILSKIPVDSGKSFALGDLETKLQTSTIQLKESSKKMKAMCESWAAEKEKLHSQIQKQDADLKEANQKQADLEIEMKMLTHQLEDATQTSKELAALRRQVKKDELSEKLVLDLKTELAKQTDLTRKNYINNQYLTIERDKLLQLSSYQETLITKYQCTIKELQTQVAEQLKALSEARANDENISSQISITQTGFVCSSPTSSFSDHSNKSWHDLSDVSSVPPRHASPKENGLGDSVHLELVSLEFDGESSRDVVLDSCQNQVNAQTNHDGTAIRNEKDARRSEKPLHRSPKKGHDKENDSYETRKGERSGDNTKRPLHYSFHRDASKIVRGGVASNKLISGTRKQDDTRSRMPINVPSPLREYPCPDWSDSTLSSVTRASADLDMMPTSNDV